MNTIYCGVALSLSKNAGRVDKYKSRLVVNGSK